MIHITVFLCGAVVMSFEILGSRVLAPNFGSSVFVWGSLIGVFMAGLSAGYWLGGRWADATVSSRRLGAMILLPAFLFITFPLYSLIISDSVFDLDLGVRSGPFLASLCLFFLPSVFLGAVSPYAARLTICSVHTSGSTVGSLYALSTLGSIAGTLLTSFYLITVAGVQSLIMAQGVLLLFSALPLILMNESCPSGRRDRNDGS